MDRLASRHAGLRSLLPRPLQLAWKRSHAQACLGPGKGTLLQRRAIVTEMRKLAADGTIEPVKVTLGITDHSYTVLTGVVAGQLKEGDDVITGAVPVKDQAR